MSRGVALVYCIAAGACGRIDFAPVADAGGDSACVGTACEPVEPVAVLTALDQPSLVASDDTRLYWTSFAGEVLACAKADCSGTLAPITSQAGPTPHGIVVDATRVYWTNESVGASAILACPLAGCGAGSPTVIATGLNGAYFLAVDATTVYWTDDLGGNVLSCPLTGCGSTPTVIASGEASPHGIAITETAVYWAAAGTGAADGAIRSCPKLGCAGAPATVASLLTSPWFVAIDASSHLYWSERNSAGQVGSCPIADCSGAVTSVGDYSFGLYVDEGRGIYYSSEADFITFAPFDGSGLVRIPSASASTRGLTADADFVYWVARGESTANGALMKIAKRN